MNNKTTYSNPLLDQIIESISPEEQQKTDKKMVLASKIANAIKARNMKKSEFAKRMGKQPSEISKWLSGTHNFTVDTLTSIESVLHIDLLYTKYWKISSEYQSVEFKPQNQLQAKLKNYSNHAHRVNKIPKNNPPLYKITG